MARGSNTDAKKKCVVFFWIIWTSFLKKEPVFVRRTCFCIHVSKRCPFYGSKKSNLWNYHYLTHRGYSFFRWKIEIYFIEWTPSVIFSLVAQPRVKILPMVFTRWNKFRSFTEKNKHSVYFMLLSLSGRGFVKIQYSSFPLFPVAYPSRIATNYNITSIARNVR